MKDRNETPNQKEARLSAFERDLRPARKTSISKWKLNRVDDIDWKQDQSGLYVLIYWDLKTNTVRLDVISKNHDPIISFAGSSDNVRKHVGRWIDSRLSQMTSYRVSAEHAAYIGSELERADTMRIDYVQDSEKTCEQITKAHTAKTDAELLEKAERENRQAAETIIAKDYKSYNRSIEQRRKNQ